MKFSWFVNNAKNGRELSMPSLTYYKSIVKQLRLFGVVNDSIVKHYERNFERLEHITPYRGSGIMDKLEFVSLLNYSGIPESYDPKKDVWYSVNVKAAPSKSSSNHLTPMELRKGIEAIRKFGSNLIEVENLGLERSLQLLHSGFFSSFLIDYGTRDFMIEVFFLDEDIKEFFEYVPFIRLMRVFRCIEENVYVYNAELFGPYEGMVKVLEKIEMIRNHLTAIRLVKLAMYPT
ncbi:hypothetical protein HS7_11940 [Sulfolobales archaeon HS-7]|nr:hypothetical protein HS7_11940 [Sulfolobales archaeon HS-7]